ncbi:uracil-DNA glycosylase family protein [Streptococcus sp. zg-JUN1979]|uniref:uracil-DNA glycosylase family protein n=1 Tax=Streptococcus sp. zg-JUN1979 TaxID=3391450 RepID=UPI0039A4734F
MKTIETLIADIMADEANQSYTERGIKPLFSAPKTAKVAIIGQAPGSRAEQSHLYFDDPSGDNLREWLGVDRHTFYQSGLFAVLPMDYYFPGRGKSGDLPPRASFAPKWHPKTLALLPNVSLTLLIGQYAQRYYLKKRAYPRLTDTVKHYKDYLPDYFPLVHPSPRNNIWQSQNPWFKEEVLPDLRALIADICQQ